MNRLLHTVTVLGLAVPGLLPAAAATRDSGADAVVIYNTRMPESRQVAEHYARKRLVPEAQVFGFDLPVTETITRPDYLEKLQKPLLQKLEASGLWTFRAVSNSVRQVAGSRIRYAALCYGVPTRILADPNLNELGLNGRPPELKRNEASVDSQLACLPLDPATFQWAGPWPNKLYGATNSALLHPTNGILLVARLDGPSPAIAMGLVDKALEAETNGLWGRAYFDAGWGQNNTNYERGDTWIRASADLLQRLGFETELDTNAATFPAEMVPSQVAFYAGWYTENVNAPFTWWKPEFMPGAFAYHLHSFSASTIRATNKFWVGPLLAMGATATMGSVDEPYLGGTPDIATFLLRFTAYGFSFGEAAWASQNALSWQNIAVGDPLYRPFAIRPETRMPDLQKQNSPLVDWLYLMVVNMNLVRDNNAEKAISLIESAPTIRTSAILQEKLASLYWSQRKLLYAIEAGDQALQRAPSPMQRLRLLTQQITRLEMYGKDVALADRCEQVILNYPQYPGLLSYCRKLLPLARKLGRRDVGFMCEREIERLTPPTSPPAASK